MSAFNHVPLGLDPLGLNPFGMSNRSFTNAAMNGVALGLYNTANITFGALTSKSMRNSGVDPFMTLYTNLDSPSGFSSWAHPSYATPLNVALNGAGADTTFAPLHSAIYDSAMSFATLGSGRFMGGGVFGFGFASPSSNVFVDSKTYSPLGVRTNYFGWA